jgi:hypothetical protein
MPNLDGMGLLKRIAQRSPDLPVIVVTAHGTIDTAVEAVKLGAFDFITKPFDQQELAKVVAKAVTTSRLSASETTSLPAREGQGRFGIIGQSPAMQRVFDIVEKVAATPSTVLITGESGTGKELIAKAVHEYSPRANGAVHQGQLRGHPGHAHRVGALRVRERRLHRRRDEPSPGGSSWPTPARCFSTRSARSPPRCRSSSCARSRRASSSAWAG